jgi:hypothetical protein
MVLQIFFFLIQKDKGSFKKLIHFYLYLFDFLT